MGSESSLVIRFRTCHHQLDEMFLLHQESLLQARLENAVSTLKSYESCHVLHMNFENDFLIPKYAALPDQGKWDATLYHMEHQKILDLYEKLEQSLIWMVEQDMKLSQERRNIIKLMDREKSFKGLCEHHQEREEASMFLELDRQTDENWRVEMIDTFLSQWTHQYEKESKSIDALP